MRSVFVSSALLGVLSLGCTPERPPPQVVPPTGETRGDAPTREPLPPSQPPDAGAPAPDGTGSLARAEPARPSPLVRVHDRVIAKPLDPAVDLAALKASVEATTGARVQEIRKGALGLVNIVFEPTDPPRTEAEQRALVEQVQAMGGFKYVEPDRLMQAK